MCEPGSLGACILIVSCPYPTAGISGKSQILFALVFTTRYLDLLTNFISIYNTVMKVRGMGSHGGGPAEHPQMVKQFIYAWGLRLGNQPDIGLIPGFAVSSCGAWAWARLLASVYLGFLLCKMKIIVLSSEGFVVKIKQGNTCKYTIPVIY